MKTNPDAIISRLRDEPFTPFVIHLKDGTTHEIRQQSQCIVADEVMRIGIPHPNRTYMKDFVDCSLAQVERLEKLELVSA